MALYKERDSYLLSKFVPPTYLTEGQPTKYISDGAQKLAFYSKTMNIKKPVKPVAKES